MGDLLQFVDSIAASPTVLLDLNDGNPLSTSSFDAPPPDLRRAITSSMTVDGDNVGSSSYGDRDLLVTLDHFAATQDLSATTLQTLGRLLNSEGQWLKWQPVGATNPVFFRTKRCQPSEISNIAASIALRNVSITIPARPFAYGLPETGAFTINNDPTAGTNPMSYVFPAVKGDVATPLSLALAAGVLSRPSDACVVAACAAADAPTTPRFIKTYSVGGGPGWTIASGVSDSGAIGGTTNTATKASGSSQGFVLQGLPTLPAGDYRLFGRFKTSTAGATVAVQIPGSQKLLDAAVLIPDGVWRYYDLGVLRLPSIAAVPTPGGIVPITAGGVTVESFFTIAGSTGAISFNTLTAVPVGLDDARASSLLIAAGVDSTPSTSTVYLDGLADGALVGDGFGTAALYIAIPFGGSIPVVVPGVPNVITLLKSLVYEDGKSDTVPVSWMYYPHYVYMRPAAT